MRRGGAQSASIVRRRRVMYNLTLMQGSHYLVGRSGVVASAFKEEEDKDG